jgi:hypothetical protein
MSVPSVSPKACRPEPLVLPQIIEPEDSSVETSAVSPPPSATDLTPPNSLLIPAIITVDLSKVDDDNGPVSPYAIEIPTMGGLSLPDCQTTGLLAVPRYSPSLYSSNESSACSTPGVLSPGQMTPGLFSSEQSSRAVFTPNGCLSSSSFDGGNSCDETDHLRNVVAFGKVCKMKQALNVVVCR